MPGWPGMDGLALRTRHTGPRTRIEDREVPFRPAPFACPSAAERPGGTQGPHSCGPCAPLTSPSSGSTVARPADGVGPHAGLSRPPTERRTAAQRSPPGYYTYIHYNRTHD